MPEREYSPDPKYQSLLLGRLIGQVFKSGLKSTGTRAIYKALDIIKEKTKKDPLELLDEAMKNISPVLEVKAKRIGGATYQIPVPVVGPRRNTLAIRWLLTATRSRKGKPFAAKLSAEIMEAAEKRGSAIKKKEDIQKMAEANRAFAHFA